MTNPSKIKFLLATLLLCGCGLQPGFPEAMKEKGGVNTPVVTNKKIFITQSPVTGNFGGPAMADGRCATDPQKPTGTFRALVADGTDRVGTPGIQNDWVLKPSLTYARLDGTVIGTTNASAVFTFPLSAPISPTPDIVWTGIAANWAAGSDCGKWTSQAVTGSVGESSSVTVTAFTQSAPTCNLSYKLICVQQ